MNEENFKAEILVSSEDELKSWNVYLKTVNPKSLDIPFVFSVAAVNLAGVVHIENPIEDTWIEGAAIGVVNGTFKLDKNKQSAKLYDPTRNLLRLVIELNIPSGYIRARVDTRRWDGKWNKGSWAYFRF